MKVKQKVAAFQVKKIKKKKLVYLHRLKEAIKKIKTLRVSYMSVFTAKFKVICTRILISWNKISKEKHDKRRELDSLQKKYQKRRGL